MKGSEHIEILNGTYKFLTKLLIGIETFSSACSMKSLLPVLTNNTDKKLLANIEQVHNISLNKADSLQYPAVWMNGCLGICTGTL